MKQQEEFISAGQLNDDDLFIYKQIHGPIKVIHVSKLYPSHIAMHCRLFSSNCFLGSTSVRSLKCQTEIHDILNMVLKYHSVSPSGFCKQLDMMMLFCMFYVQKSKASIIRIHISSFSFVLELECIDLYSCFQFVFGRESK